MRSKRTLGDKINRGFALIVIILGSIMVILGAIRVVQYDRGPYEYGHPDYDSDHFIITPDTTESH